MFGYISRTHLGCDRPHPVPIAHMIRLGPPTDRQEGATVRYFSNIILKFLLCQSYVIKLTLVKFLILLGLEQARYKYKNLFCCFQGFSLWFEIELTLLSLLQFRFFFQNSGLDFLLFLRYIPGMFDYCIPVHSCSRSTIIAHIMQLGHFLELSYIASYFPKDISKFLKDFILFYLSLSSGSNEQQSLMTEDDAHGHEAISSSICSSFPPQETRMTGILSLFQILRPICLGPVGKVVMERALPIQIRLWQEKKH